MTTTAWHILPPHRVVQTLTTDASNGLSSKEIFRRRVIYGSNTFQRERPDTVIDRLFAQFRSPLVLILFVAGSATLALGHHIDATVIFIALAVNVGIGLFQEARASRAFEKLSASQERSAVVVREGVKRVIDAIEVVPGDLVVLDSGSLVPADMFLLETRELEISEAPLTGESIPVRKEPGICREKTPIAEQTNMAWMGTFVVSGDGAGLVVATGDDTQMGRIAEGLADTQEVLTPVQRSIRHLARFLSALISAIVLIIFVLGLVRGESFETMLLLAIAVAVSVIPEGLPAAVTAILAIGMEKILSRGGLVRNLLAAETLGSTTVILTDKTGTLTKADMRLFLFVTASGVAENELSSDARRVLTDAIEASDAFIENDESGEEVIRGRPIEQAILKRAHEEGLHQDVLDRDEPERDFLPFNSHNRFAVSLRRGEEAQILHVSGSPDVMLEYATLMHKDGQQIPLTSTARAYFRGQLDKYAAQGVRFIAAGYKKTYLAKIPKIQSRNDTEELFKDLVFGGLLGFEDSLREDVPKAVNAVREAGARVIMLTGDNPETARSIAQQAGIVESDAIARRGSVLVDMTDDELRRELKTTSVFARMLPDQKLRIVKLLQEDGEVVAMTGDGINDAPALKRADIGVAVGSGTEVAQEASDLVLLNNSFSIIVAAIEEGRRIIDNLKKAVAHLLSTSFGEVFVITGAIAFGLPLPILAVQILWLNIIEEGLLTFGFAFEPPEEDIMRRSPHSVRARNVITKEMRTLIIAAGSATGIVVLVIYLILVYLQFPIDSIRTIVFTALSLDAIFFAISLKNFYKPIWKVNLMSNTYLLMALGVSVVLLVASRTLPVFQEFLGIVPFDIPSLIILGIVAVLDILIIETAKYFLFRRKKMR